MFLKLPEIIIIGFGENIVLYPIYIDIYDFGWDMVHRTFFVYYFKKRRKDKTMIYTKIEFYTI